MPFSVRQWLILIVLIAGFGVAAHVVSQGDTGAPEIDTAAWCGGADGLNGLGPLFDGTAADPAAADYDNAREALFTIENSAPFALRPGIARLADFALLAGQQVGRSGWPVGFDAARGMVEIDVVDQAIADMETELRACGLGFLD